MLDQMKKQAEDRSVNLKVGGKKIHEIEAEDLAKIGFDEIEKAREAQVQRERQEKIRQRKLESKRVDHLSRAYREEEKAKIDQWAEDTQVADDNLLDLAQERDEEEQHKRHDAGLVEKKQMLAFVDQKTKWVEEQLETRYEEHQVAAAKKLEKAKQEEAGKKIE